MTLRGEPGEMYRVENNRPEQETDIEIGKADGGGIIRDEHGRSYSSGVYEVLGKVDQDNRTEAAIHLCQSCNDVFDSGDEIVSLSDGRVDADNIYDVENRRLWHLECWEKDALAAVVTIMKEAIEPLDPEREDRFELRDDRRTDGGDA